MSAIRLSPFRAGIGLAFCAILLAGAALAASPARQRLETTITAVLDAVRDPAYADASRRPAQRARVEGIVRGIFDAREFSLRTVGPRWKTFTPQQQEKFAAAFTDLLIATYVGKIDGYNGEQVQYLGETASSDGGKVEISTALRMKDGKIVPVSYRMLQKDGSWCVYDVLVENLSLVKNYRTQFQDILVSAAPDDLIARVAEKARQARESNGR